MKSEMDGVDGGTRITSTTKGNLLQPMAETREAGIQCILLDDKDDKEDSEEE